MNKSNLNLSLRYFKSNKIRYVNSFTQRTSTTAHPTPRRTAAHLSRRHQRHPLDLRRSHVPAVLRHANAARVLAAAADRTLCQHGQTQRVAGQACVRSAVPVLAFASRRGPAPMRRSGGSVRRQHSKRSDLASVAELPRHSDGLRHGQLGAVRSAVDVRRRDLSPDKAGAQGSAQAVQVGVQCECVLSADPGAANVPQSAVHVGHLFGTDACACTQIDGQQTVRGHRHTRRYVRHSRGECRRDTGAVVGDGLGPAADRNPAHSE